MIINGSNSIQGLFNYDTVPADTIWTVGDIVLKDNTLYTCKQETTGAPDISTDNWIYYLGGVGTVNSLQDMGDINNNNNLVTLKALNEFIQDKYSGYNSDGVIKLLTDPTEVELDTMLANSSYQLSIDYLNSYSDNLPFIPNERRVYVIRTTGDLNNGSVLSPTIFVQELIEVDSLGNYYSWVRSGTSLNFSSWVPTRGDSFNSQYVNYVEKAVESYTSARTLYLNFMQDVINGEYKYWKSVSGVKFIRNEPKINFDKPSDIDNGPVFSSDKFYKIHLLSTEGSYKSLAIDISPEDHLEVKNDLSVNLNYGGIVGLILNANQVNDSYTTLNIPDTFKILSIKESATLIL
jgi:hypothetical protein